MIQATPDPHPMTCLITRPAPEGPRFAARVEAVLGLSTVVSPLMRYAYPAVSIEIDRYAGVILTSAAAVPALKRLTQARNTPVFAVGAKTAEVASTAGFEVTTGPGDAQGLIDMLLESAPPTPLVHLRGAHTRGDVARRLTDAGYETDEVVVYQQVECALTNEALQVLGGEAPVMLPLFSPRTADILGTSGPFAAPLCVVAISDAVARACASFGTAAIRVADTPDADAMLRQMKDMAAQKWAG